MSILNYHKVESLVKKELSLAYIKDVDGSRINSAT